LYHIGKELKFAIQGIAENNKSTASVLGSCISLFWPWANEHIQWDSRASSLEETLHTPLLWLCPNFTSFCFCASRFSFPLSA